MAGEILGAYVKAVMSSMLSSTATLLFPQHRKRIDEMQNDVWYPLDEYVQMVNDLHAKLGDATMTALGQASITKTFQLTKAAGLDTLDKVFKDFSVTSKDVVRNGPPGDVVHTVSFTKDTVVLESETRLPPSLLIGYFRGLMFGFGKVVTNESVERKGSHVRFTLKYL
ncbi:hypothetical protein [Pyxidicoccus xibeiensis]|uniref:hypothetical protein n=1 Tax=Pyxidicoccus xibeiensis TaxID=2906759 RepID=UPI0020A8048E|nr:hypothetical protein [Pyxidicoccus xibeiensis]MCP3135922.1 hypothetical protein [Pyxidicoccus xibeiensis]